MTRELTVDGRSVCLRASAAIPRIYRMRFRRDILKDMREIQTAVESGEDIPVKLLEAFENMAFIMAKHADPQAVPEATVEDWLDSFSTFSIYQIFPVISELWAQNLTGLETSKKNKSD